MKNYQNHQLLNDKSANIFKRKAPRESITSFGGTLIHKNGLAIELSVSFAELFGYRKTELLGKNIIKLLIPAKYHGVISENIKRNYSKPYTIEGIRKDGSNFKLLIEGSAIKTANDTVRIAEFRKVIE